jgi:hypothetical protein
MISDSRPYFYLLDVLITYGIQEVVVLEIKYLVSTARKKQLNNGHMPVAKIYHKTIITYLSWAEKVNTLPLTSSNSTKPGYFSDSVSNNGNPLFNCPLLMYLENNHNQRKLVLRNMLLLSKWFYDTSTGTTPREQPAVVLFGVGSDRTMCWLSGNTVDTRIYVVRAARA